MCFKLERGRRPYILGEIVSPTFCPWGSFGHKVFELLSSTIKDFHGNLMRPIVLQLHYLDPKNFYLGRDKSGLEAMT
jgi:hypothetical protein